MILGIIAGLGAALCQSISYLFSKRYILNNGSSMQLLTASHFIMGGFAAAMLGGMLCFVKLPPLSAYIVPLTVCNGFYLLAQAAFFLSLQKTEASRLAPLLGMKILFLAIISSLLYGKSYSATQWVAVIVCLAGAAMSNWSGGSIPLSSIFWILLACMGYSVSDINIKVMINGLNYQSIALGALMAGVISYTLNGIIAAVALCLSSKLRRAQFMPAVPFSIFWFGAMLFLFCCFGLIGPLFGNIIQSSRGIMSVLIGVVVVRLGLPGLEKSLGKSLIALRIIAALLIAAAVVLFTLHK